MKSSTFYFYDWPLKVYKNIGIWTIKPMCHTIVSNGTVEYMDMVVLKFCYLNNLDLGSNQKKNTLINCQCLVTFF